MVTSDTTAPPCGKLSLVSNSRVAHSRVAAQPGCGTAGLRHSRVAAQPGCGTAGLRHSRVAAQPGCGTAGLRHSRVAAQPGRRTAESPRSRVDSATRVPGSRSRATRAAAEGQRRRWSLPTRQARARPGPFRSFFQPLRFQERQERVPVVPVEKYVPIPRNTFLYPQNRSCTIPA